MPALDLGVFHREAHVIGVREALALILLVVGVKMLVAERLKLVLGKFFNLYLLLAVLGILAGGVLGSLWADRRERAA